MNHVIRAINHMISLITSSTTDPSSFVRAYCISYTIIKKWRYLIQCEQCFSGWKGKKSNIFGEQANQKSKTCLNQTSLGRTCLLRIDRSLFYTGCINKDFLHWEFISSLESYGILTPMVY